jgi:cell division protein FtsI (penicillin-binding protein 3)
MRYARDKYIAAFAGFVPARDPKIAILVVVDEPKRQHYGGVVAAPVFRRIAREALQHLKIPPELVTPDEAAGSIRASREALPMG